MVEPEPKTRGRPTGHRTWLAPTCIVLAFAAANALTFYYFPDTLSDYWESIVIGIWVFQPMCLAIWTALGPETLWTRVPVIFPCLTLVIAAHGVHPTGFSDVERYEFIAVVVAGTAILFATTALLLVVRRFFGWLLETQNSPETTATTGRVQFDIKYMLALITLYSTALGVVSSLRFAPPDPSPFFGPRFMIEVLAIGTAIVSATLLPIIAVPLVALGVSISKHFAWGAVAFWAILTSVVIATVAWLENDSIAPVAGFVLLIQLGAAIEGIAVGVAARWAGFRLIRHRPIQFSLSTEP